MKLSISNIGWNIEEEEEIISTLKSYGVDRLEVAPTKIWDSPLECSIEEIDKYRIKWKELGIEIVAMQSLLFGQSDLTLFAEEENRVRLKEYLRKIIKVAGVLGSKVLVFGSPKNRLVGDLNKYQQLDIASSFFHEIGQMAFENNVVFCIEPNPPQYGCDFVTNTDQGVELVREVNHSGFRLHLDAAAMSLNQENYFESIEKSLPYLAHFHISDPFLNLVGEDKQINHRSIAKALESVHYEHTISIEMKSGLLPSNVESVKRALDFVRKTYG